MTTRSNSSSCFAANTTNQRFSCSAVAEGIDHRSFRRGETHQFTTLTSAWGRVIDFRENEQVGFDWTLRYARVRTNNADAVRELEALRPYPGPGALDYGKTMIERKWNVHYGGLGLGSHRWRFLLPRGTPFSFIHRRRSQGMGRWQCLHHGDDVAAARHHHVQ